MSRKQITFYLTRDEADALKALAGSNQSEYLRALIRQDAAMRGIDWPSNALRDTRGQYPRLADDALGGRLADTYISVANGRAAVARVEGAHTVYARNWETLEDDALRAVEAQGGRSTMSAIYKCPPELAARAEWKS